MKKNIGLVIITHNETATALLKTTEMLCGVQSNIEAINFYGDMDNVSLQEKCEKSIKNLNIEDGIIFLVDVFGGTPFNVAFMLSKKYKNSYIIIGVNIPMILEAYDLREEDIPLNEKIDLIKKAAIEVILGQETSSQNLDDE